MFKMLNLHHMSTDVYYPVSMNLVPIQNIHIMIIIENLLLLLSLNIQNFTKHIKLLDFYNNNMIVKSFHNSDYWLK